MGASQAPQTALTGAHKTLDITDTHKNQATAANEEDLTGVSLGFKDAHGTRSSSSLF